jgi:hypothetical protein
LSLIWWPDASCDSFLWPDYVGTRRRTIEPARERIGKFFDCDHPTTCCGPKWSIAGTGEYRDWQEPRPRELDQFATNFSVAGEKQKQATDEATLFLLKQLSFNPDIERPRVEFERAQKAEEIFHKDFDGVDFTGNQLPTWELSWPVAHASRFSAAGLLMVSSDRSNDRQQDRGNDNSDHPADMMMQQSHGNDYRQKKRQQADDDQGEDWAESNTKHGQHRFMPLKPLPRLPNSMTFGPWESRPQSAMPANLGIGDPFSHADHSRYLAQSRRSRPARRRVGSAGFGVAKCDGLPLLWAAL